MKKIIFLATAILSLLSLALFGQNLGRATSTGLRLGSQVAPTEMLDITGKQVNTATHIFTSGTKYGCDFLSETNAFSGASTGTLVGLRQTAQWGNDGNLTKVVGIIGGIHTAPPSVARTVTNALCFGADYTHTDGNVTTLTLFGSNTLGVISSGAVTTCVGLDLGTLIGTNKISLRSTGATATMRHAGKVLIGGTYVPVAQLEVVQSTIGSALLKLSSTTAITYDPIYEVTQGECLTTSTATVTIQTIPISITSTENLEIHVVAMNDLQTQSAGYVLRATYRNPAATATLIGSVQMDYVVEDIAGWNVTLAVSGANVLVVATGAAATNITWNCTTEKISVLTISP